jgi:hypothetical protein
MTRCHDAAAEPPDTPHAAEPQGTNEENDVEIMAAPLDALTVAFVVSFAGTCPAASERRLPMSGADAALTGLLALGGSGPEVALAPVAVGVRGLIGLLVASGLMH